MDMEIRLARERRRAGLARLRECSETQPGLAATLPDLLTQLGLAWPKVTVSKKILH